MKLLEKARQTGIIQFRLRKDGEKLIALLAHPLVAEMAAAGLMAFATRSGRLDSGRVSTFWP